MSDATPAVPAASPRRGKLIVAVVGLALAAGGAAGWAWSRQHDEPAQAAPKKQMYSALETFTVNLQEARGDRFAQVGVTLQFEDAETELRITEHLPAVRNAILLLLSAKQVDDLLTPQGKETLSKEIRDRVGETLRPGSSAAAHAASGAKPAASNPIRAVLFSQFIVQ